MARIKGSNTNPERVLRRALSSRGVRYRINLRELPGHPDLVFPRAKVVVFIDGCFWHGCPQHRVWPATRSEFWRQKLTANSRRDRRIDGVLRRDGWTVVRVWEHDIDNDLESVVRRVTRKLNGVRTGPI